MINHGFDILRNTSDLALIQGKIKDALDVIAGSIQPQPILVSFLVNGHNGTGSVALPPPTMPDGRTPLRRANIGARMVAAINITDVTDVQKSFEQVTTVSDQIRQTSNANLSAKKILFILSSQS